MSDVVTQRTMAAIESAVRAAIPTMLVGEPGTSKSASMRALAAKMNYEFLILIGSQMEPTDVAGMPRGTKVDVGDGVRVDATVYSPQWWQILILKKKRVFVFLDEFSNTSPATRASLLTFLQDRVFPNGQKVPKETVILGAMNPAEQAADGYELDLPTANRFFFVPWTPTVESWCEGMETNWGSPCPPEELVWKSKIVRFIRSNPTWLHRIPQDVNTKRVFGVNPDDPSQMEVYRAAWPSRRSWDNLSKALSRCIDESSVQDLLAQGLIGFAASAEFRDWLTRNDSLSPQDVIDNPDGTDWTTIGLSEANVLMRSIVSMSNDENFENVVKVFEKISADGREGVAASYLNDFLKKMTRADSADLPNKRKRLVELVKTYREVTRKGV